MSEAGSEAAPFKMPLGYARYYNLLPPVQAKIAEPASDKQPVAHVHAAAALATSGGAGQLPHLDTVQRSFGHHDLSHVRAYTDTSAAEGTRRMGAEAFASGERVAFAGAPSLHTVAHEAAHVIQQACGVQLETGVGRAGDRYEQHADLIADRVVRGESSEALLDELTPRARGASPAIQHKLKIGEKSNNSGALVLFLNAMCMGLYEFGIAESFLVMRPGSAKPESVPPKLLPRIQSFAQMIARILGAPGEVTIDFVAGSKFLIGNFELSSIDLGDIQTIAGATMDLDDPPVDFYTAMAHEISEQYYKQSMGMGYEEAHGLALEREVDISGYRRVDETVLASVRNEDSTYTSLSRLTFEKADESGQRKTVTMQIEKNKITRLETKDLPPATSPSPSLTSTGGGASTSSPLPGAHGGPTTATGTGLSLADQLLADFEDDDHHETPTPTPHVATRQESPPGAKGNQSYKEFKF